MSEHVREVFLAIDLGASSGRVIAGIWDGNRLEIADTHRFATPSSKGRDYWHWDVSTLYSDITLGIAKAVETYGSDIVSAGVDTWGVDYGLIDSEGRLLANPICYRDDRTDGLLDEWRNALTSEALFAETGIQSLFFNTLYQISAEVRDDRPEFRNALRALFLPDLFNYWLSGKQATERSIASTSQMLNPLTKDWSSSIFERLGVEKTLFGDVIEPGTSLGKVTPEVAEKIGYDDLEVIAVTGHDTACAFMALPRTEREYAILSSGTWSLMGLELDAPNCSASAMNARFSNEIGFGGSVRFLRNICGFWLLEECRRIWREEGIALEYEEIVRLAGELEPMTWLIDPDDAVFATPGDMPQRIRAYCEQQGGSIPETPAEIARCIFDSLAM